MIQESKLVVVIVCSLTIVMIFGYIYNAIPGSKDYIHPKLIRNAAHEAYLVFTPACKIPKVDPFDSSVKNFLVKGRKLKCDEEYDIVYQIHDKLFLNKTAVRMSQKYRNVTSCTCQTIWRPFNKSTSHNFLQYLNDTTTFNTEIKLKPESEFVQVRCFGDKMQTKLKYTNFFTNVHRKEYVEKRCLVLREQYSKYKEEEMNVMMLGIESVSQINMVRYMKKTREFLLQNLSAIELVGYNKIADNTFPNVVVMTTGKYLEELPWNETVKDIPLDKYDFIWKKFSEQGYRTFYAEDAPKIAIFDYHKAGFSRPPADYYNRHFSQAMEEDIDRIYFASRDNNCINARPETSILLDYLKQFMTVFKTDPYFAFTFITRLTHDKIERAAMADELYLDFFRDIKMNGILNKTIIFFYSDHGIRFGKIRETFIGKLEERLPFMFLIFPEWFLNKYPNIHTNLKSNAKKLTTPFDIFATLLDILSFRRKRKMGVLKQRSISLMDDISDYRTCNDVDMLPHWCSCAEHEQLPVIDKGAVQSAKQMIEDLNKLLDDSPQCEKLILDKIKLASKLILPTKVLTFKRSDWDVINRTVVFGDKVQAYVDYQIQVETKPGGALFEGTIRYNENTKIYNLTGEVSRINLYGEQSHCVNNSQLKKICYCKIQIS